jgi:prevent-host-death family protein
MKQIGSYEAKTHLPQLLDAVEAGEIVVITRHGRPAARLMPITPVHSDLPITIAALQEFGKQHRGRLSGLTHRTLLEDGRRF